MIEDPAAGCFVDGRLRHGTGSGFDVRTPWSGDVLTTVTGAGPEDIADAVESATAGFRTWSAASLATRHAFLTAFAEILDEQAEELAELQVRENGKLLGEMVGQARQFGDHMRYYASLLHMPSGYVVTPPIGGMRVHTERRPLGVVAAITPWNSPLNLLVWKVGPALAAGNSVVVKPSEITPLSTLRFAESAYRAGLPAGVLNVVTGGANVGERLIGHRAVAKVAFTGSSDAGERIARAAATGLRRVSLELGGKSANIVFADADREQALRGIVAGIFGASGQTCMAGSRILVEADCYAEVVERLADTADRVRIGNPLDPASQMGPVACTSQLEKIEAMVAEAVDAGATVVAGGRRETVPALPGGLFYRPTVLTGVTPNMTIFQKEVFGPVAVVLPFETEDDAVELADGTRYGLAAGVWTSDRARSDRMAERLSAGTVWINNYRKVAYNVPFGGVGLSGIGRENGHRCLDDYTETKAVWTDRGLGIRDPFDPRATADERSIPG
ncbi:MAG: aldehyde dehydrogenase family protein [Rhodococcus sp.]|uniref:aldehyde dehydrogenase family protein n=1 Tax=Rhodococcus TaxID=1827 RepID=UPI0016BB3495|nr:MULTISPECIES: aldehyde dehydrogenase family protein [Rhodococcus]NLV78850.1 aldehyde dehydrogenase family protein [Rhodococcus sp. (in: high G+C Gram-positive bacteria)]